MFCIRACIKQLPANKNKLIIFIRHAEKESLTPALADFALAITPDGRRQTYELGHYLKTHFGKILKIKTSPLTRCLQTALILANCFKPSAVAVQTTSHLGNPGVYVSDDQLAAHAFQQYSIYDVVNNQVNDQPMPGLRTASEGAALLLQEIRQDIITADGPIIYISHDVILAAFIGSFVKEIQFNQNLWTHYLEGCCMLYAQQQIFLYLADRIYLLSSQ